MSSKKFSEETQKLATTETTNEIKIDKNSFLQSQFWADIKKSESWKTLWFKNSDTKKDNDSQILILYREFKFGYKIAYIPYAYSKNEFSSIELKKISNKIKTSLPPKTIVLKWDLPIKKEFSIKDGISETNFEIKKPFKKSVMDIQPPNTVILNIEKNEDEILSQMHKKTRYNIKLSKKKGVTIREAKTEELHNWYKLYQITAKRDKIAIHSQDYYQKILDNAKADENSPEIKLYFAEHEKEILAGIIVCYYKKRATYLYGASSNKKRNLMPAYLLQWNAIKEAKKRECTEYDFFGIPPTNDPKHPMYGLYRFKTGFGGKLIARPGVWDFPILKLHYKALRILEKARYFYFKKLKKR